MTEGALAHGYRGAKMAPASEIVDRSGNAPARRLTSKRPGVASGQPYYRYRGYYKNRDFFSHKPPSLSNCSLRTIFRKFFSLSLFC